MLVPVRHLCNQRLFDAAYETKQVQHGFCDFSVKCTRCKDVVRFVWALPRSVSLGEPLPIICGNPQCGKRLLDVSLAYELTDQEPDLSVMCQGKKCKYVTGIRFGGVVGV